MRKKISAETKAAVALEAIKGLKTVNEIASIYEVHPTQVGIWKKQFKEGATAIFSTTKEQRIKSDEQTENNLYRKIGQLEIENEFLKKSGSYSNPVSRASGDGREDPSTVKPCATMYIVKSLPQWQGVV